MVRRMKPRFTLPDILGVAIVFALHPDTLTQGNPA